MPQTWVALDLETTGLDPSRAHILEVAAVRIRGDTIAEKFTSLVAYQRRIPAKITTLTGIDKTLTAQAPALPDVLSQLLAFLGNDGILAHNAVFDRKFLHAACRRTARRPPPNAFHCTLALARRFLPSQTSYGLHQLAAALSIPDPKPHHRALPDALVTARLWLILKKMQNR